MFNGDHINYLLGKVTLQAIQAAMNRTKANNQYTINLLQNFRFYFSI